MTLNEGYYRIAVNLRSKPDDETYKHLHADILKDNVDRLAFCDAQDWFTTSMHTIVYMERFKMFQVRITAGTLSGNENAAQNLIQVEKLN